MLAESCCSSGGTSIAHVVTAESEAPMLPLPPKLGRFEEGARFPHHFVQAFLQVNAGARHGGRPARYENREHGADEDEEGHDHLDDRDQPCDARPLVKRLHVCVETAPKLRARAGRTRGRSSVWQSSHTWGQQETNSGDVHDSGHGGEDDNPTGPLC